MISAPLFCQLFRLFHGFQRLFVRPKQGLFHSSPCILVHLAQLFHAKSKAKCRILHCFFMQKAKLSVPLSTFLGQKGAKSPKMAWQMPLLAPYFPTTTPCENGLFAADGQIVARESRHNVKKRADFFTY